MRSNKLSSINLENSFESERELQEIVVKKLLKFPKLFAFFKYLPFFSAKYSFNFLLWSLLKLRRYSLMCSKWSWFGFWLFFKLSCAINRPYFWLFYGSGLYRTQENCFLSFTFINWANLSIIDDNLFLIKFHYLWVSFNEKVLICAKHILEIS